MVAFGQYTAPSGFQMGSHMGGVYKYDSRKDVFVLHEADVE